MDNSFFIKSQLASEIFGIFKNSNDTQNIFAKKLFIRQPKLSRIFNSHLAEFSIDTLIKYLEYLGAEVEVKISYKDKES